jgi:LysM domain
MFKRNFILPFLTTLVISALFLFISCAHTEKSEDDADLQSPDTEEQVAGNIDDGGGDAPAADGDKKAAPDLPELTEESGSGNKEAANAPADDKLLDQAEATPASNDAKGDAKLEGKDEEGFDELSDDSKGAPEAKTADAPPAATENLPPATDTLTPPPTTMTDNKLAAASTPPATDGGDFHGPSDAPSASPPPALSDAPTMPVAKEEPKKKVHRSRIARHGGSTRVPQIPGSAKEVGKILLNRFYFARKGDTAASVSELIYGNADKAQLLSEWNHGAWKPGKLLFYNSPTSPEDRKMLALYQENGVTPEEYTVQKGDWLSKIAAKKLGSPGSWTEIAVVNGLEKPHAIEVGQKIALYTGDLHGSGANAPPPQQTAEAPKQAPPQAAAAPAIPPPGSLPPPSSLPPQLTPPTDNLGAPPPEPVFGKKPKSNNFDVGKMVEQNLFAVSVGGVLLLLMILLVAVNRKKKSRHGDDFADDAFMAPKSKRK